MSEVLFHRFHPVTGADAGEFDTVGWTTEQKEHLAAMIRGGARFYWEKEDNPGEGIQGYTRIEKGNAQFAMTVAGIAHRFVERHGP